MMNEDCKKVDRDCWRVICRAVAVIEAVTYIIVLVVIVVGVIVVLIAIEVGGKILIRVEVAELNVGCRLAYVFSFMFFF